MNIGQIKLKQTSPKSPSLVRCSVSRGLSFISEYGAVAELVDAIKNFMISYSSHKGADKKANKGDMPELSSKTCLLQVQVLPAPFGNNNLCKGVTKNGTGQKTHVRRL